ncbi:MAG: IPT/TIG domain-containing protein [Actinomycetota bacterium]|nr:IPT/TIG domain-containing protein [Actinomycetota bacterium]
MIPVSCSNRPGCAGRASRFAAAAALLSLALVTAQFPARAENAGAAGAGSPSTALAPLPPEASYGEAQTWYLAEGYTGGEFDTWVLVQNPGVEAAHVTFDFQLPPGSSAPSFSFDLPGRSRQSFHLDGFEGLSDTDVSTRVTSSVPVMVERAMYFSYNGKTGGHDSIGVKYPSNIWYFAEGYTGGEFDTWVLVQNPGDANAHVTLEFQLPPGSSAPPFEFDLPAGTRRSIHLDELPGLSETDVSTKVVANIPVVAERAVYFDYFGKTGGHDSIGVVSPSERWFLAEGYTGGDFDTWVLVQNPGDASAHVRFDFQLPPGSSAPPFEFDLPARSRQSFHLDDFDGLSATDVSTMVTSNLPVVAERAMYFNYFGKTDGHDSVGVDFPSDTWYLAEGYTGGDFDTWVLVQNPGEKTKHVILDFQLPPGSSAPSIEFDLPGGTRQSIHLDDLPGLSDTDVSTKVSADGLVVAERAMYFNYGGKDGGHCSAGALYEPPIIPDTTKVLGDAELGRLAGAAKSGDGKELVLTFSANVGALQGIEPGDVIVGGITANTPYGILQKVTKVNRAGGQVILNTVSASLEEAVWRGHLYQPLDLSAARLVSTRILAEGVEFVPGGAGEGGDFRDAAHMELPFTYNFNNVKLGTDPDYLLLNGKVGLTFKADFNVDIDVGWPSLDELLGGGVLPDVELKSADFGVTVEETADIRGSASVTKNISYEKDIVEHEFTPINVQIGPVPVILVPYVNVHVGVDGTVSAGISFGAMQKGSVYAGVAYDGSKWTPKTGKDFSFEWTPPSGNINADVKVYAGPQFGIKLYGICGPYLNLEPFVRLVINTATPPLWKVFVGIEVDIGVKAGIDLEFEADLGWLGTYEWKWSLELFDVKWDGALSWEMLLANAVKIDSLSPGTGEAGTEVTIKGSGFGDTRENDSYVKFGSVAATEYTSWNAGEIRCRVPAGVSGTVQVKVTHIFHRWGPVTIQVTSNGKAFTVGGGGGGTGPGTWDAQSSGTTEYLNGVDALDASHVWAVGSNGTIRFFNGSSWGGQSSGTTQPLYDVSAAAANRVWAVGYQGTIRYFNGSSWSGQSSGTSNNLNSVYAADASHVWAVGANGTIRFFNGSSWGGQSSGTSEDLYSVEGLDASHVWAVGANGTMLFYNGSGWSKVSGAPDDDLGDIWVKDASNIWVLGVNLYYYNGSGWETHHSGWTEGLVSVAGLAPNRVWTGRWYGVIHFWNGSDWVVQDVAGSNVDIMDIDILDPTHMWAVGKGTILFNDGT